MRIFGIRQSKSATLHAIPYLCGHADKGASVWRPLHREVENRLDCVNVQNTKAAIARLVGETEQTNVQHP